MKTPAQKLYEYWAHEADNGGVSAAWQQLATSERSAWQKLWEKVPEFLGGPDPEQMDRDLIAAWEKGRGQRIHTNMIEDAPENSGAQHHRNCPLRTGRGAQCGC